MTKRCVQLYLNDGDFAILKARGLNISSFVRNLLSAEAGTSLEKDSTQEEIAHLKLQIAKLKENLDKANETIEKLKKELKQAEKDPMAKLRKKAIVQWET